MSKVLACTVVALAVLGIAGCSSMLKKAPGITYAEHARQLGINPVYPPREDLQVGDVYAVEVHTMAQQNQARSAFVAPVDLSREISAYLGTRYKFVETQAQPQVEGQPPGNGLVKWQADVPQGKGVRPALLDYKTLPAAGFPRIEVDSGVSIGVGGQPTGLAVAFGFAAAKTLKMSLQYSAVTSYEVPPPVALRALEHYCDNRDQYRCASNGLAEWINQKYQVDESDDTYVYDAGALMITKVYLARKITYTFSDSTLAAAAAATVAADKAAQQVPIVDPVDIAKVLESKDPELVSAMGTLMTALATYVQQSKEGEMSLRLAAITRNSVSIEETFPRAVVVGYEGVSLLNGRM